MVSSWRRHSCCLQLLLFLLSAAVAAVHRASPLRRLRPPHLPSLLLVEAEKERVSRQVPRCGWYKWRGKRGRFRATAVAEGLVELQNSGKPSPLLVPSGTRGLGYCFPNFN